MARFITGDDKRLCACINHDSRGDQPRVCESRYLAVIHPFRSEEDAATALLTAGAVIDVINSPRQPGRIG